jgi:hypothetical protein
MGEYRAQSVGKHQISLRRGDETYLIRNLYVAESFQPRPPSKYIWDCTKVWNRGWENVYSAWLELLFLESGESTTWKNLHEVTRNPEKNLLHNHLGLDEDTTDRSYPLVLTPDCADNPFVLRAYFAWKLGLPYGHHRCDFGYGIRAPQCSDWRSNLIPRQAGSSNLRAFQSFINQIKNQVHSGSARTALVSERGDLYPLPLQKQHLRPGTVYADPYGHTLTLVRWIPQTDQGTGKLLAVDAQPDRTIAVKRFWQGNFLFATQGVRGEPGFKAFRPIVKDKDTFRPLNNRELAENPQYANYSLEQRAMAPADFYDAVDRLINPHPLDPIQALEELLRAVYDRLLARIIAVQNGEKYMQETAYAVMPMPSGARIFQTTGPWEDFSTPSRDLRLLIALDVLLDFPDKVRRRPDAFGIPLDKEPSEITAELQELLHARTEEITISYIRSDGKEQVLTMAQVLERMEALEMAYNPNDCVEIRWGAPEGSEEFAACIRRAPAGQRQRMASYRDWFRNRVIPVR